jgi:serine/threonine-protein kinase
VSNTTIGKYRLEAQIGRGATGVVYKATDPTLNREVAIKVLRPDAADAETLRRFRTEAAILARLNHPDIATIYELVHTDTELFMVMELVAGESLEAVATRAGRLAVDAAAYLIDRVLAALSHAHEAGIVHRDLKPANVMVTRVGGVKVMDFGIARVYTGERITQHGSMMGTPGYMAPEQILGNAVDARADVYAVGAMLYRLLAGVVPFDGDSAVAVIQRQISEPIAPIRTLAPEVSEAYDEIVARAMARAPDDRFQTADEFRQSLGGVSGTLKTIDLAKRFALGVETPAGSPVGALDRPLPLEPVPPTIGMPGRRLRTRWMPTAAIVTVAALAGIMVGRRTKPIEPASISTPPASGASLSGGSAPPAEGTAPVPRTTDAPTQMPSAPAQVPPFMQPQPPVQLQVPTVPLRMNAQPHMQTSAPLPAPSTGIAAPNPTEPGHLRMAGGEGRSRVASGEGSRAAATVTPPVPAPIAEKPLEIEPLLAPPPAAPPQPVKVFDAKLLALVDAKARELEARLVLEDKMLTVTAADDVGKPLETVPYETVKSISYSVSRDPLWMSTHGPVPVVKRGGALSMFGISVPRHWVALRTAANTFVVLRLGEVTAPALVASLEERTGRHSQRFAEVRRFKD